MSTHHRAESFAAPAISRATTWVSPRSPATAAVLWSVASAKIPSPTTRKTANGSRKTKSR